MNELKMKGERERETGKKMDSIYGHSILYKKKMRDIKSKSST